MSHCSLPLLGTVSLSLHAMAWLVLTSVLRFIVGAFVVILVGVEVARGIHRRTLSSRETLSLGRIRS